MQDFLITCCSTADMPLDYFQRRNIPFICFHFIMEGKEYPDDLGQTIPFDDFYARIAAGAMPTTSQVNINEFVSFFEPYLAQGKDILHISTSSGISGTYNSAVLAREQLQKKYPNRTLQIVDSLGASSGYGMLVDLAVDMKESGATLTEIYNDVMKTRLHIHHWFFSTDLAHYKRGGRISATSAVVGTMLNICPLMNIDHQGRLIPRQKIPGKKRVIREIVQKMEKHAQNGTDYAGKCFISHSACYQDAREVADLIEQKFPHLNGKVMINSVGTAIGSHTGPGTVALYFLGDERLS